MRAVSGTLPANDEGWAYEIKWDGMRAISYIENGTFRMQSSTLAEITLRFPELKHFGAALAPHAAVLDGEIVRFNDDGRPSFGALQHRMHIASPREAAERAATTPVCYLLFDVIHLDGTDTTDLPYSDRRRVLEQLVPEGEHWQLPPSHVGDGLALYDAAAAQGLEGLMAKRLDSHYEAGRRSQSWRKIKIRREQEFVVGGWHPGQEGRAGMIGSLHLGYYESRSLRYAGKVGTGFTLAELRRLDGLLSAIETDRCPFDPPPPAVIARDAHWVEPKYVAQVAFGEWTDDAILRHPAYLGLRIDKDPSEVVREP
jgi:bifunctional non-homologous end joining protein LigD